MWSWVDRLAIPLAEVCISAFALWSIAALALLGTRQPARRLGIARVAVLGSLALWPLIGLDIVPRFDVLAALRSFGIFPHPLVGGSQIGWRDPVWALRTFTIVYATGVAAGIAWMALGWLALSWMRLGSMGPSARAEAVYESILFAGRWRRPRLRVSGRVRRPFLAGVLSPQIVVPAALDSPENVEKLRLTLLHEVAHAEANDPWHSLLGSVARSLWFFAPPLWWVDAQSRLDQEFLADRRAVLGFGAPPQYVSSLLEFSTGGGPLPMMPDRPASETGSTGTPLFQRVLMLLRCPFPVETSPPAWWSWSLSCVGILITLGAASLSVVTTSTAAPGGSKRPSATHTFFVQTLETHPLTEAVNGRSMLCELPIRLPDQFQLDLEVWGTPGSLANTRVTGLPLAVARKEPIDAPDGWHKVHLSRGKDGVRLTVGEVDVPLGHTSPAMTAWLSVESPPAVSVAFRNIKLTW